MLIDQIKADQLQARKEKNTLEVKTLTSLIGDITGQGIHSDTSDEAVIKVVRKHLKGVNETFEIVKGDFTKSMDCMVEKTILNKYLPQMLTDDEVRDIIQPLVEERNIGKMMGAVKQEAAAKGKLFDGAQVQRVFKDWYK